MMSQYVRCLKNETYFKDDLASHFADLEIGQIYKRLPLFPEEAGNGMIRVIDGSGEAYLYPADYFEPVNLRVTTRPTTKSFTIHLDELTNFCANGLTNG